MYRRLKWLDLAKGIGIFLMVIGHTGIPSVLHNWIYSFHMPLFILISGMLFNTDRAPNEIFKSRAKSLLLPYFFFMFLLYMSTYVIESKYWQTPDLVSYILHGSDAAIWFLIVLFFSQILYSYFCKYKKTQLIIAFISLITGYVLYTLDIHLPYKAESSFYFLFFLLIGSFFSKQILSIKDRMSGSKTILIVVTICCSLASLALAQISNPVLGMAYNNCGNWYLTIPVALMGTLSILLFCVCIESRSWLPFEKFLLWCGNNTIAILGLSQLYYVSIKLFTDNIPIRAIYLYPFRVILTFLACYATTLVLNKYLPVIVGKRKINTSYEKITTSSTSNEYLNTI